MQGQVSIVHDAHISPHPGVEASLPLLFPSFPLPLGSRTAAPHRGQTATLCRALQALQAMAHRFPTRARSRGAFSAHCEKIVGTDGLDPMRPRSHRRKMRLRWSALCLALACMARGRW